MPDNNPSLPSSLNAALLLADGTIFWGTGIGANGAVTGEICFNTAMTGYQEVLTDPSYEGQIITFTFPHIGNVGCNAEDIESEGLPMKGASGLIVREPITSPSNFRALEHFNDWLMKRGVTGICGVDTRALTRHIRKNGAQNALIAFFAHAPLQSSDLEVLREQLAAVPDLKGMELAKKVTTGNAYEWQTGRWKLGEGYSAIARPDYHVVAVDYGEKLNILRSLASLGCKITVVSAETSAEDILALKPNGVFLSNGPGDPAATGIYAIPIIQKLVNSNMPVFGICLGHQLLGLACGGKTEKMHQGHRGANHPIKNLETGKVEITSQNHGFVVSESSLPDNVVVTHKSLFDGTVAGLRFKDKPVFSVQYHPESSPGPHDSLYLFQQFVALMKIHDRNK